MGGAKTALVKDLLVKRLRHTEILEYIFHMKAEGTRYVPGGPRENSLTKAIRNTQADGAIDTTEQLMVTVSEGCATKKLVS